MEAPFFTWYRLFRSCMVGICLICLWLVCCYICLRLVVVLPVYGWLLFYVRMVGVLSRCVHGAEALKLDEGVGSSAKVSSSQHGGKHNSSAKCFFFFFFFFAT